MELKSGLPDFRPDFATKTPYYWDFLEMILYVEREKNMIDRPDYYYYYSCFVSSSERRGRVSGERNPHTAVRHLCHGAFAALNDESES